MTPAEWAAVAASYVLCMPALYSLRHMYIEDHLPRSRWERAKARLSIGIVAWPAYLALLLLWWVVRRGRMIGRTFQTAFGSERETNEPTERSGR